MQKKRSISITQRKNSKKKTPSQNKKPCSICITKGGLGKLVQKSLFQKYSEGHISELRLIDKCIQVAKRNKNQVGKQYMEKYYKIIHRKHQFPKIKQVYKLYQETPRLYMPNIREIINKCYHRKRLLEYFKIAKILGIRVDTVKFSTFMLSLSKSKNILANRKEKYDPLIGQISGYEFSEDVQRQLIQTLSGTLSKQTTNEPTMNPQTESSTIIKSKQLKPTAPSKVNIARLKIV